VLTVLLGLSAAFAYAGHDLLMVRVTRLARPLTGMFWVLLMSLAIMLPLALVLDGLPHGPAQWRAIGWAAVGGVFYVAALLALLRGFAVGALSLVTPLAALEGAFATVFSVLAGESIGGITLLALPLAVVGGLLASVAPRAGLIESGADSADTALSAADPAPALAAGALAGAGPGDPPLNGLPAIVPPPGGAVAQRGRIAAGAGWGLLSGALFAVTLLTYGRAGAVGPVTAAAAGRLVAMPLVVPLVLFAGAARLSRRLRPRTLLAGACEAGGYVASAAALARGPVSVASVMIAQFALFAVILGIVVLRERPARHQLLGIACTVAAVILFGLAA
jgi:drug/metabolite transporter (DMT)-like permease